MPLKSVTRLRKNCGQLAGHSRVQATRSAQAAAEQCRDFLPEGGELTLLQFQLALGKKLEHLRRRLTALDDRHAHELQVDRNLREDRDSATSELRERLFQLRDSLDGLFGTGGGAKIFEDAPRIPDDPTALHQLTGRIHNNLSDPGFEMPAPLQKGFKLERDNSVTDFEEPFLRLDVALTRLEETESDSKFSQSEKDLSVDEAVIFVGKVARFYEAFYALVGLDKLAQRVRRSSHRRNDGEVEEPDREEPETDEAEESENAAPAPEDTETELPKAT
ncbi:MAG: hypothetical protein GY719_25200 [bacterium]|nr:hypothetical protein [bacterium]